MTTTIPTVPTAGVTTSRHQHLRSVPFVRLVRVETRKLVDTRAGRALLIVIGVITAGVIALLLRTMPPDGLTFAHLTLASAVPQGFLLPILGVLAATGEWTQRTGLVTFTLEPRRGRVAAAKLVAAGLVGLSAVGAALVLGALTNVVGMIWFDGDGSWSLPAAQLGGAVVLQLIGVAQGVAFGLALQSSIVAIVAFLVLPTVWSVVGSLVSRLEPLLPWLDLGEATSPLLDGAMKATDWAHVGTAALVWLALPYAIGVLRLTRREVK